MGVKTEDYPAFFATLVKLSNLRGALVTMPHKVTTVGLLDEASTAVKVAGSCNAVLVRDDGRVVARVDEGERARQRVQLGVEERDEAVGRRVVGQVPVDRADRLRDGPARRDLRVDGRV